MAGTPKSISMVKQILHLHGLGYGIKTISRDLGISKNTVRRYLRQAGSKGLPPEAITSHSNESLEHILLEDNTRGRDKLTQLRQLFPDISSKLEETGFTLHYLWCKYKETHPGGYQYSQFCHHYQKYRESKSAVMHFEHEAGDKMFVDYAGKKLHHVEYGTGEIIECEFFVSVLGQSQYTYGEASPSQQKEDFIASVQNALHYYGGVPKVLVPDNLKSAVSKSSKYDPALNEDFLDMANHYGCGVLPARSRKPRDKSLVENHIRTLYTRVHAELSQVTFFSLEELNGAILRCLEKHNGTPFQGKDYSRRQLFEETEREALNPLPGERFEIRKTKQVTVMKNCHVQLSDDRHYYSVPYRHIGEKVKLSYTSKEVCVYLKGERVAFHLRDRKPYKYTTVKEHLPSHHRFVSEWNPEKFINWAVGISPEVKTYIEGVLSQKNYPETLYRACVGILSFAKKAGKERLVTACRMGIRMETYNYGFISKVLANNTDKLWAEGEQAANDRKLPGHENLRGSDYYKDMCND